MVYYNLVLNDKHLKENEIYPVEIRLTFKRQNTTISTGIRVKKYEWDTTNQLVMRSNPNFNTLNQSLSDFFNKIQKIIHQLLDENQFSFYISYRIVASK